MVKASVRSGKVGPTAEKLVYSGLLTQLMHDHLSCGRRDSRSVSQVVHDPDGLPLDRRPGKGWARQDLAWKGAYLTWCRQHPSATLHDRDAMRMEFKQKFHVLEAFSVFPRNMVQKAELSFLFFLSVVCLLCGEGYSENSIFDVTTPPRLLLGRAVIVCICLLCFCPSIAIYICFKMTGRCVFSFREP